MYLTQALHRSAQQHSDKTAKHFAGRSLSLLAFQDRIARLAAALRSLGMRPGDRVAMLSFNSDRQRLLGEGRFAFGQCEQDHLERKVDSSATATAEQAAKKRSYVQQIEFARKAYAHLASKT